MGGWDELPSSRSSNAGVSRHWKWPGGGLALATADNVILI
jgi:hypothetical protein